MKDILTITQKTELQEQLVNFFRLKIFDRLPSNSYFWIAGGAILNRIIGNKTDFDFFFCNETDLQSVKKAMEENGGIVELNTDKAIHIKWDKKDIDLVKFYYNSPQECIDSFDFTVSCVAIDKCGTLFMHKDFYEHLAQRALIIHKITLPLGTLRRSYKYQRKGFHICLQQTLKIAEALKNADYTKPQSLYID